MITTKLPKEYQGELLNNLDEALQLMIPDIDLVQQTTSSMTWALSEEEKNCGLATASSDANRRENVKAKWRSQFDVSSFSDIVEVATSFQNGEISADYRYSTQTMTIEFISQLGIPKNIESLKSAIRDIIPAHIAINWIFKYRSHEELAAYTHKALSAYTHKALREKELNGNTDTKL